MSNYNNKNQIALPESFEQEHISEAKKFLRSGQTKDDILEILSEIISEYLIDNVEELPSKEVIENFIQNITPSIIDKAIIEYQKSQSIFSKMDFPWEFIAWLKLEWQVVKHIFSL